MEELYAVLEDLRPDLDFYAEKKLIDNGLLDSFDILSLVASLSDTFDVEIKPGDLTAQNFNSAENMWSMIQTLQED